MGSELTCRQKPCQYCPYRKDVPSGVWHFEEYMKLIKYDAPTGEQPLGVFLCHAQPSSACSGWVAVGNAQPHENDLLALRIYHIEGTQELNRDTCPVPLFETSRQAAMHGLRDIENPGPAARAAIKELVRRKSQVASRVS